jgi:hypothetical protein
LQLNHVVMLETTSQPAGAFFRKSVWLDCLLLVLGAGLCTVFIRLALTAGDIHLRGHWDLVAVSLLLAPLGPTLLGMPRLPWRRFPRAWTIGEGLWLGAAATSLAWLALFLDAHLRVVGGEIKFVFGPAALLVTPVLGLAALINTVYSLRRPRQYGWRHWFGLLVMGISASGWLIVIAASGD